MEGTGAPMPASSGLYPSATGGSHGFPTGDLHTYKYIGTDSPGMAPGHKADREPAMLRKNITITPSENEFLERHPEINQSALFRQVVESLMNADKRPKYASVSTLRLGKAVYRSGAVLFKRKSGL